MSTNNYILNLLNIKDKNIHIITECKEKVIKNKNYKLRFQGKLAEKKVTVKKILGIGISYDRKTKKHSCQVEWL